MRAAPITGAVLLAWAWISAAGQSVPVRIESGKPFPILELPLTGNEGKQQSIEAYRGRKLMLHLFASW